MEIKIPDLTKLTWPFNIALVGAVFSIFALIYNPVFIYYGFLTFLYGILGHLADMIGCFWLKDSTWSTRFVFTSQIILTELWIGTLLIIYC